MDVELLKQQSETRQVKLVFKNTVNDHNTLFGGSALQWMDEVAYITATRFCRKKVVTISVDKINFLKPIQYGAICELVGKIGVVGRLKLKINVEVFAEQKYTNEREKAVEGIFTFAAIDKNNKPVKLFDDPEFLFDSSYPKAATENPNDAIINQSTPR
jgi:acyl-CoA hydrolase